MSEEGSSKRKGFAALPKERVREIASKGGKIAHERGLAHEFTPDEAREAGRLGGRASQAALRKHRKAEET